MYSIGKINLFLFLLAALAVLSSCRTQNMFVKDMRMDDEVLSSHDSLIFFKDDYEYTIRKDDKISISVWGILISMRVLHTGSIA